MSELMLVNPRRRRKRKLSAKQRVYFGGKKRRRKFKARRRRSVAPRLMVNPRKRRRIARYRRNPIGRGFNVQSFTRDTLMPSAIGAAGALGLDVVLGFLPLPAAIKTGPMKPLVKLVGAVGLGMLAGMVTSRKMAEQITAGAVTVVLYDTIKGFAQRQFPALPLGDTDYALEYVNPAQIVDGISNVDALTDEGVDDMSMYVGNQMGEYVN